MIENLLLTLSSRSNHFSISFLAISPIMTLHTKKATIFINTTARFTLVSAIPVIIVNATIPRISSIKAAPKMAFPLGVLNLPISFNVSTLILTDVAVKITPMNMFCKNALSPVL